MERSGKNILYFPSDLENHLHKYKKISNSNTKDGKSNGNVESYGVTQKRQLTIKSLMI